MEGGFDPWAARGDLVLNKLGTYVGYGYKKIPRGDLFPFPNLLDLCVGPDQVV